MKTKSVFVCEHCNDPVLNDRVGFVLQGKAKSVESDNVVVGLDDDSQAWHWTCFYDVMDFEEGEAY